MAIEAVKFYCRFVDESTREISKAKSVTKFEFFSTMNVVDFIWWGDETAIKWNCQHFIEKHTHQIPNHHQFFSRQIIRKFMSSNLWLWFCLSAAWLIEPCSDRTEHICHTWEMNSQEKSADLHEIKFILAIVFLFVETSFPIGNFNSKLIIK